MRPIDAEALREKWLCLQGHDFSPSSFVYSIDNAPTVDVVPVVHGYDTSGGMSLFRCSVCGWFCWDTYCGDTDTYNYCPNCGAKMDGKKE